LKYLNNAFVQFFAFIHAAVSNVISNPNFSYGIAIILVTLIIRLLILPLNIKQTKSSLRMNELQPEIKKLQAKYKNDPQRLNKKTMELYKEKGVNPLGGCLPLLIQWPIFIALYYVFNTLTGINGVSFLWVKDLAKPDVVLAVLSGATTYFSGTLMASGDSSQAGQMKSMNIGMSIFMIVISWKLKSALVLYWVINNLIQIIQTVIMKKMELRGKAEA